MTESDAVALAHFTEVIVFQTTASVSHYICVGYVKPLGESQSLRVTTEQHSPLQLQAPTEQSEQKRRHMR